jgi:hypothetical protein
VTVCCVQARHVHVETPKYGSPAHLEPPGAEAERLKIVEDSHASERLKRKEPRIIQACVQCVANLACDNESQPDGTSTVDKIVAAGAVHVFGFVMSAHQGKPRLLEDAMCALSNIAFVSDEIRLVIGRNVTSIIVEVARSFGKVRFVLVMTVVRKGCV